MDQKPSMSEFLTKFAQKLSGHVIVLDPRKSGMFIDKINNVTMHFFKDGEDRFEFKDTMDATDIYKGIKAGLLRVMKDDKDVSVDFGGTSAEDWRVVPIVEDVPNKIDKSDDPLIRLLGRNKDTEIVRDIRTIQDRTTLERLKELEMMGKNSSSSARLSVVNALDEMLAKVPGVGKAGQISEAKQDIITAK